VRSTTAAAPLAVAETGGSKGKDNEINKAFVKEQRLTKERGKRILALIPLNIDGMSKPSPSATVISSARTSQQNTFTVTI
jgi:hypothetical protein